MKDEISPRDGIKFLPHFPTVLVGTGTGNKSNLITVAMVHVFSIDPPMIGIGISPKRHSFKLLEEHGEFTVNIPDKEMLEEVKDCGSTSGEDTDKFKDFDLTREQGGNTVVPGVRECPLILECEQEKRIETGDHHWFVGEVVNAMKSKEFKRSEAILYWSGEFRTPGKLLE
ncbi:MAG: flavin reductase family protein [Candidatus Thermoplasmatota archaeon]|nr:flavin reductase family protein [Candidatus Thermoplasmatota archaeon]MBS3789443.1 flavin reductase family protein [Candidatus Thermoplasmatota archaeon]